VRFTAAWRSAALRLGLRGRAGCGCAMRRALRTMLLGMRRSGLIMMLAILRERGRTRDKADNRG